MDKQASVVNIDSTIDKMSSTKAKISDLKKEKRLQKKAFRLEKKKNNIEKKVAHNNIKLKEKNLALKKKNDEINIKSHKFIRRKRKDKMSLEQRMLNNNSDEWFKLDNAGSIYPAVQGKTWNFVFRISALLKDKVKPDILQQAVTDIMPRFPTFNVTLKRGVFWYYFETKAYAPKVIKETRFPCMPFDIGDTKQHIVRVLYGDFRISFECFHAVADGRGAELFFNTLLRRYFELLKLPITGFEGCLNYKDLPQKEEAEDSFFVYRDDTSKSNKLKENKAFKIKGTEEEPGVVNTVMAEMSVEDVKKVSKSFGCSLYVFLCASLAYSIVKRSKFDKKPVKISVPIDLRSFFPSQTLRNFSSYINVEIPTTDKDIDFKDVVSIFKNEFDKIDKPFLIGNINANTGIENNVFIKIVPLFIKDVVMRICFKKLGEDYQTLAFSNLGVISTPPEFHNYIDRYEVNLGRNKYNTKSVGVVSFGDKMVLTLSSKIKDNLTERSFIRQLSKTGIKIKIESNRRDMYGR